MSNLTLLKFFNDKSAVDTSALAVVSPSLLTQLNSSVSLPNPAELGKSTRIVGYARRSSKNDDSHSIDRQRSALDEYAQRKFGRPLDDFFSDESISGRTWKRQGLQKLMKAAEDGQVTDIVVEDLDRVARALHITAEFKHRCDGWGVRIHSCTKGDVIDSADVALRGYLSADQVLHIRSRCMAGKRKKVSQGSNSGHMPYGYEKTGLRGAAWRVDESKRDLIEYAYLARLEGMECGMIANILNSREIESKSGEGTWRSASVKALLTNPKYMGLHIWGLEAHRFDPEKGKVVITKNDPKDWIVAEVEEWKIIDKEMWDAVFRTFQRPTQQTLKRPHSLLSSEHVVCAGCGTKMTSRRLRRGVDWELRCFAPECTEHRGHPVADAEEQMLKAVRTVLTDTRSEAAFVDMLEAERDKICDELAARRTELEKRIGSLDAEIETLLDATIQKEDGIAAEKDSKFASFTPERLARRVAKRDTELAIAKRQLAMLPRPPDKLDPSKRVRLLEAYDKVVEARRSDEVRSNLEEELLLAAEAAIGSIVEAVKIESVHPGRASRYEVIVRQDAIYGDVLSMLGEARRSIVGVVHKARLGCSTSRDAFPRVASAYSSRAFAATDEQFAAVSPAISDDIRRCLASAGFTTRDYVDLVFLATRTNVDLGFLAKLMPKTQAAQLRGAVIASIAEEDGTWERLFSIVKARYPQLFQTMNTTTMPGTVAKGSRPRGS